MDYQKSRVSYLIQRYSQIVITKNILIRFRSFEVSERQEWPRNALKFTDTLLSSLKKVSDSPDGPMAPLFDSIHILNEMVVLYENYKIPITFSKFTQVWVSQPNSFFLFLVYLLSFLY